MAPLQQGRNAFEIFKRQFVQLTKTDCMNNNFMLASSSGYSHSVLNKNLLKGLQRNES